MKITPFAALIALALLPAHVWGQAAERVAATGAEAGIADFRISHMGPDGDPTFDAFHPAVAYNNTDGEYLVVWAGDHGTDGEVEIYGQRLQAATGARLGRAFRISHTGPDGDPAFDAARPAVAYNAAGREYLVVWAGTDAAGRTALYGQRLAATGAATGAGVLLIAGAPARRPAVVYNPIDNEYLVVWEGEEDLNPRAVEIFGQRLDAATGEAAGTRAFRISTMGRSDGDPAFGAYRPAVAYNPTDHAYLVVWQGDDDTGPHVDEAFEIFGQRLDAAGARLGAEALRISDMGPDGAPAYRAFEPAVAYNATDREYLVVWVGDDNAEGLADDEYEVYGQRLDAATGKAVGANDFRISAMGPDGDPAFDAALPTVAYNPDDGAYLVVWRGDHYGETPVDGAYEIYSRRLAAGLSIDEARRPAVRISRMGSSDEDARYGAVQAAVAYGADNGYLAVWHGDDDGLATDNEHEIFGRRIEAGGAGLDAALAHFAAEVDSAGVLLTWTTTPARDDAHFEVQHKTTTGTYEVLGERTGPETANARQYTFRVPALPPGRHTFRLKQTDATGTTFSAEVEALVDVPGRFLLTAAYPNPFNQSTTVTLTLKETQYVDVAVYDMLGRRTATLYQGEVEAYQARPFSLEATDLPSGPYFIRAAGESFVDTRQVLLVR